MRLDGRTGEGVPMIVLRQPYPSPAILYLPLEQEVAPGAAPAGPAGPSTAAKVVALLAASVLTGAAAGLAWFEVVFGL